MAAVAQPNRGARGQAGGRFPLGDCPAPAAPACDRRTGLQPPHRPATADSLAIYTQTVLQGGFVLSKARRSRATTRGPAHLKNYLALLLNMETLQ
jgi:hypothetical protein